MSKPDFLRIDSKKFDAVLHQFVRLIGEASYLRKVLLDSIIIDDEVPQKTKKKEK